MSSVRGGLPFSCLYFTVAVGYEIALGKLYRRRAVGTMDVLMPAAMGTIVAVIGLKAGLRLKRATPDSKSPLPLVVSGN